MELAVLGPLEVHDGGRPVEVGKHKLRALLAALALSVGRPVSVDTLIDLLWGDAPPAGASGTLQSYVSTLRRALEPERRARARARVLVTAAPGYALLLPEEAVDARRFEQQVRQQHRVLQRVRPLRPPQGRRQEAPTTRGEVVHAEAVLVEALSLWRGTPFLELGDAPDVVAERARLEELQLIAEEGRACAELALGRPAEAAGRLEALALANPLHEQIAALHAVALARCGRQADALEVLRLVRGALADELGIEPGADLRSVQQAILRQEAWLEWRPLLEFGELAAATTRDEPVAAGGETHAHEVGDAITPAVERDQRFADPVAPWPMLGRDIQLAALLSVLDTAASGRAAYAVVCGEAGIGKTRLARETAERASRMGFVVALGRCSQDDGAPPLWPWTTVLEVIGSSLADLTGHDRNGQFAVWDRICRTVRDAARQRPLLLVLEDLHWADTSTLRVLRLLVESVEDARLAVLVTWRSRPEPTGALADVAEALARHHARRLDLVGLGPPDIAEVVLQVAGIRTTTDQAAALARRTEGNPFFVVEYARLAEQRGDLDALLSGSDPPTAVQDVISRRIQRLPERTRKALEVAAVIGRRFDGRTLAAAAGIGEDDLLDVVDPAHAAGLLREDDVDTFSFAHALVRDTVYTSLGASRRARTHATVAGVLAGTGGRETEEARHWLAAGPSHSSEAWRSAVRAAGVARSLHAHDKAVELLDAALVAMGEDPTANGEDRYVVLMELVDACRWAGMWGELTRAAGAAVAVARAAGDPIRVAEAAISTTRGGMWQSAAYGQVNEPIVDALRLSLTALPDHDSGLRCRVLLGLANELYYGSTVEEKEALVADALAMARRLGDEALLLDALLIAYLGSWRPATAPQRLGFAIEATDLAQELRQEQAFAVAATLRAVALGELGHPDDMRTWATIARGEAERLRLPYVVIVLANLELPWHAMAGRFERCDELVGQSRRLDQQLGLRQAGDPTTGALLSRAIWQAATSDRPPEPVEVPPGPFARPSVVASYLWRTGQPERAREVLHRSPIDLDVDDWTSMLVWCSAAEVALYDGDAELAERVRTLLVPYQGRSCSAGSSNAAGPVDAYLALAAAAASDLESAGRHAEDALDLCAEWDIPLAARWLRGLRRQYSF